MNTHSFIVHIKANGIYKGITEKRSETSNYQLERLLLKGKTKKVTGLKKDDLGGKIMKKIVGLRAKIYSYLIDDGSEDRKAKDTKMVP